jgi:hypothetical protein
MSWPQICSLLHAAGAGRADGLPFSHGHLSATVWRQRQKAQANPQPSERARTAKRSPVSPPEPAPAPGRTALPPSAVRAAAPAAFPDDPSEGPPSAEPARPKRAGKTRRRSADMRAHLKRAADARRGRAGDD